jgi:hypothetical protein
MNGHIDGMGARDIAHQQVVILSPPPPLVR